MESQLTQRVGKYDVRIEFEPPTPEAQARRIEALTAWLLDRWQAERREEEHADARAAG